MNRLFGLSIVLFLSGSCRNDRGTQSGKSVFRYNEASGITSLDPAFARDQANGWATSQMFNGLLQFDDSLKVIPCIAKDYQVSEDGRTYTFHLRTDVYFHENQYIKSDKSNLNFPDSRKVLAEDFVYSFHRLTNPSTASPGAWVLQKLDTFPDALTARNDSTLVIRLREAFAPFPGLLCMPYCSVVPREVVTALGNDFRNHPCGTGPFVFQSWKEGSKLILLKNRNYFEVEQGNRLPYLDAVEVYFINDKQSAFIEFLKGNLDFFSGLDASYKDELLTRLGSLQPRHQGHFNLETEPYLNTEYLGVYMDSSSELMKNNPLNRVEIRKALSLGFDKQKMMAYLRNNMGTPGMYGIVPPGLPSFDSASQFAYGYDPALARNLLMSAGFPGGRGMPEIILSTTNSYLDLCEYIKSQWEELGVKVKIDVNQAAIHRKMVAEKKLAFFRASWIADYPDAENYLSLFYSPNFTPAGPNYTHYSNREYDSLYVSSCSEVNDSIRYVLYRKMDRLMMEQAPVIILYYDRILRLTQKNIEGLKANAMNLLILKRVRKTASSF